MTPLISDHLGTAQRPQRAANPRCPISNGNLSTYPKLTYQLLKIGRVPNPLLGREVPKTLFELRRHFHTEHVFHFPRPFPSFGSSRSACTGPNTGLRLNGFPRNRPRLNRNPRFLFPRTLARPSVFTRQSSPAALDTASPCEQLGPQPIISVTYIRPIPVLASIMRGCAAEPPPHDGAPRRLLTLSLTVRFAPECVLRAAGHTGPRAALGRLTGQRRSISLIFRNSYGP